MADTMRAYRLLDWQRADFDEVPVPVPGPGQVRVRVGGVGLCHSDVIFLEAPAGLLPYDLPFTLGHEIAGWIDAIGDGTSNVALDEPVAVACMSPCGDCRWCRRGQDNYCVDTWHGRGFGIDGGLAEYLVVDAGQVVPLGDLDPRIAGPLTDAGATSYHAVKKVLPKIYDDSTVVVIGVGGLGAYGVQWLRMLTPARIIAVEAKPERIEAAVDLGAHDVVEAGEGLSKRLAAAIGDGGADAILDFVGSDATIRASFRNAAKAGAIALVGQGFGSAEVRYGAMAHDCDLFNPQGATIAELHEVIALAKTGEVVVEVEHFAFDDTPAAYDRLEAGTLNGRAVVLPNG
ncbi:MAG TPA: alcohol dehydrogenase catalytic domain-containing protein [Mycobacteriales bacterium]|nr:alcohol dehydrogenase catalytic domain-containing protein [Mycobacteriales bacterium]